MLCWVNNILIGTTPYITTAESM